MLKETFAKKTITFFLFLFTFFMKSNIQKSFNHYKYLEALLTLALQVTIKKIRTVSESSCTFNVL